MQVGVGSFGAIISDPGRELSISPLERLDVLLQQIVLGDEVGLDVIGVGQHHRNEFVDSAPTVTIAAVAARTQNIRLANATVPSVADPVRVSRSVPQAIWSCTGAEMAGCA
jgi:alkanesulfonate monooxygenase SsuD/methylene tetrahydromethanopterin reductase-like flavin-dependent oxidoreductase (luciferase family)